jgi:hypothetical protein
MIKIKCITCNILLKPYENISFVNYDDYTYTHLGHKWEVLE